MFIWAMMLGGPLVLPLAFWLRPEIPHAAAEGLLVLGVIGLFLAICATEAVNGKAGRSEAGAE